MLPLIATNIKPSFTFLELQLIPLTLKSFKEGVTAGLPSALISFLIFIQSNQLSRCLVCIQIFYAIGCHILKHRSGNNASEIIRARFVNDNSYGKERVLCGRKPYERCDK